jgi:hypothetical protein
MPQGYKKDGTPANPTGKGGFGDRPEDINRLGVTSEAHRAMHAAAEASALAKERMAEALLQEIEAKGASSDVVEMIRPEINAFLKEAVDRIAGTAKSSVDLSSEDGSMTPKPNKIELVAPSDGDADAED